MAEKAILPLNEARMTAGYKNLTYLQEMGFNHFGVDMADDNKVQLDVYAPFTFKVTHVGFDELMGWTIIGVSVNAIDVHHGPKAGERRLAIRMAHLAKTMVRVGDVVKPEGAAIAQYGSTGRYGGAPHLHIELDTDISYPNYSPTLKGNSNIWKGGTDSTVHPMNVLKVDTEGTRGLKQKFFYAKASGSWLGPDDIETLTYNGTIIKATGM